MPHSQGRKEKIFRAEVFLDFLRKIFLKNKKQIADGKQRSKNKTG
jgi:hypothetical protein